MRPKPQDAQSLTADDEELLEMFPSVTGNNQKHINILLINPNSTESMTQGCLESIAESLPPHVTVHGFTAPKPSPSAIEGQLDQVISASVCVKAVVPIAARFDAFLVACFSAHPLIPALREVLHQPVIGIMEAALYASRFCGTRLGVVTTSVRSAILHGRSIDAAYGLGSFSAGCESSKLSVLELGSKPREEVNAALAKAAKNLVDDGGADCVCLGCAGMTDMKQICKAAVGMHERRAIIVDGVGIGVHFLVGLVREDLCTARHGGYT